MQKNDDLLKSAEELCRKAELHRQLMCKGYSGQNGEIHHCECQDKKMKLRQAICESIAVIEETKKAFKSKRLESLRKKLIQVLADSQ